MNDKLKSKEVEQLFKAILSLEDVKECYDFFEDVCTINELLSLAQRFDVAKMLREQKRSPLQPCLVAWCGRWSLFTVVHWHHIWKFSVMS